MSRQPPNSNEYGIRDHRMRWMPCRTIRCLLLPALACAMTLAGSAGRLSAQSEDNAEANREYAIKAAYLYQFGRYVQWPAKAFPNPQAPFVIGVLADDPVVTILNQIAQEKKIDGRPIQIRRFSPSGNLQGCHILYLSASLSPETQVEAIRRALGHGMLLVGDSDGLLERGGMIQFVIEDNKVRVNIALKTAKREGLTISAKLLQVAHVVE